MRNTNENNRRRGNCTLTLRDMGCTGLEVKSLEIQSACTRKTKCHLLVCPIKMLGMLKEKNVGFEFLDVARNYRDAHGLRSLTSHRQPM